MAIVDEEGSEAASSPPPPKSNSLKKYFRDLFTGSDPGRAKQYQVLDVAPINRNEIYLAIEESGLAADAADRRVFARLCLAVLAADGTIAKYRSEDEGEPPSLTDCPLRILNLLTPSAQTAALKWRLQCYEKQIGEAQASLAETKERYGATRFDQFRNFGRKSAEMMIERRFLILHQALSAEQTTKALLLLRSSDDGTT